jgi:hypothetical protein
MIGIERKAAVAHLAVALFQPLQEVAAQKQVAVYPTSQKCGPPAMGRFQEKTFMSNSQMLMSIECVMPLSLFEKVALTSAGRLAVASGTATILFCLSSAG